MRKPSLQSAEALEAWVREACGDTARFIALIDPSRYRDVEECAQALGMDGGAFEQLPNLYVKYTRSVRELGPRLLIAPADAPVWKSLFDEAFSHQAASFLVLPEHGAGLEDHLLNLVRMPQPDGGNLLFRFQDAVVLSALAPLLQLRQKKALLGPASHWILADLCANRVMIESEPRQTTSMPALRLDQRQLDALGDALAPMTVIFQANETDATLLAGLSKCEQVRLIRARMHRARRHGLRRDDDIALYCVLSLQLPADFDRIGPVADALNRARKNGTGFGDEIDQVPVQEWREWDEALDVRAGR